jgi:hypothetical protein
LTESQQANEIQLLRLVKFLKKKGKRHKKIDCYIVTMDNYRIENTSTHPYGAGLTGLAYSIAQEDHRFLVRNLDLAWEDLTDRQPASLLRSILNEPASNRGEVIKLKAKRRYKQRFLKLNWNNRHSQTGIRNEGVYVILGGSGNVGRIITRHLIKTYKANIIWIGRTSKDSDTIQAKIKSLQGFRSVPFYIQADVTNLKSMQQAVDKIKKQYGAIDGAFFSGLVFNLNNSVSDTTEAEFLNIFNVKTKGSLNFYTVFQKENLDFMCYFSSGQAFSFSGASKFSAYAAGITFSDAYIQSLINQSKFPVGTINWGFWLPFEGGMDLSRHAGALEHHQGIKCFERFVYLLQRGVLNQVMCLKTSEPVRELMNFERETNES